jgi:hypothetical protein
MERKKAGPTRKPMFRGGGGLIQFLFIRVPLSGDYSSSLKEVN